MNNVILQTDLTYQPTVNPMAQMGTGFWVAYFIFIVLMVISMWKVYEKAGQPGWAAIIPVYNLIVLLKIIKRPSKWIWYYAGRYSSLYGWSGNDDEQSSIGGVFCWLLAVSLY